MDKPRHPQVIRPWKTQQTQKSKRSGTAHDSETVGRTGSTEVPKWTDR